MLNNHQKCVVLIPLCFQFFAERRKWFPVVDAAAYVCYRWLQRPPMTLFCYIDMWKPKEDYLRNRLWPCFATFCGVRKSLMMPLWCWNLHRHVPILSEHSYLQQCTFTLNFLYLYLYCKIWFHGIVAKISNSAQAKISSQLLPIEC